jgi:hypothetical protein
MFARKTLGRTNSVGHRLSTLAITLIATCFFSFVPSAKAQTCGTTVTVASGGNIQTAINSATSGTASSQYCIHLSGNYTTTQSLQILNIAYLVIDGQNSTTITYSCSSCTTGYAMFEVGTGPNNGPANITIQNMTLEGNSDPTAIAGIAAYAGSGHTFHNLTIQDFPGNSTTNPSPMGIHLTGDSANCPGASCLGTSNSHINTNTIKNIGTAAPSSGSSTAAIRCSWGSSGNSIQQNTISNVGRDGIAIDDYSTDAVVKYNTISGTGAVMGQSALGIEILLGSDGAQVDGNTVDHWISIAQSSTSAVRHNTILNNTTTTGDIGLEFAGGAVAQSMNGIFTWNTVGPSSNNIPQCGGNPCAQQVLGASISSTVASANAPQYSYWANNTIQNMTGTSSTNHANGIQLSDTNGGTTQYHYFYNNTVTWSQEPGNGVKFEGGNGTDYVVFDTNFIQNNGIGVTCGNGGNGIAFETGLNANYFSFVNNTIGGDSNGQPAGNGGDGVFWTTSPSNLPANLEWSTNTVSNNGGNVPSCNNAPSSSGWNGKGSAANFSYTWTGGGSNPPAGSTITFMPTPDSSVQHVIWDFDDGTPVASSSLPTTISHKYPNAGPCTVSLIIWDTSGAGGTVVASRATQTIQIGTGGTNCNLN